MRGFAEFSLQGAATDAEEFGGLGPISIGDAQGPLNGPLFEGMQVKFVFRGK